MGDSVTGIIQVYSHNQCWGRLSG